MVSRGGCGSVFDDECAPPSCDDDWIEVGLASGIGGRSVEMADFVGLDVSVKETSLCVVNDAGEVVLERK
jgi:hypothetical protein